MGWTGIYSSAASLKEAAEIYSRNVSGLGYSKQFNADLTEDICFEIEDYRLKSKMLTLLIRNTRDPLHREIVCCLIDLDKEQSEFFHKGLSVFDGLVMGFPMVKTWSRQLYALYPSAKVNFYINAIDSHLYINDNIISDMEDFRRITAQYEAENLAA